MDKFIKFVNSLETKSMQSEKFTTTSMTISAILGLIKAEDIAIPEIQRPFVTIIVCKELTYLYNI